MYEYSYTRTGKYVDPQNHLYSSALYTGLYTKSVLLCTFVRGTLLVSFVWPQRVSITGFRLRVLVLLSPVNASSSKRSHSTGIFHKLRIPGVLSVTASSSHPRIHGFHASSSSCLFVSSVSSRRVVLIPFLGARRAPAMNFFGAKKPARKAASGGGGGAPTTPICSAHAPRHKILSRILASREDTGSRIRASRLYYCTTQH